MAGIYDGQRIVNVQISCITAQELQRHILGKIAIHTGDLFSETAIRASIREIYSLNWFSQITVDAEMTGDGVRLTFCPLAFQTVSKIQLHGNSRPYKDKLEASLGIKPGEMVSDVKMLAIRENILSFYRQQGYYKASASLKTEAEPGTDKVILLIDIQEGAPSKIGSIAFEGQTIFTEQELLKISKLKIGQYFKLDVIGDAQKTIQNAYLARGYLDAASNAALRSVYEEATNQVNLVIVITEGAETTIELQGNTHIPSAKLRKQYQIADFANANKEVLEQIRQKFLDLYHQQGFAFAQVTYEDARKSAPPKIIFTFDEGMQARVKDVTFEGNQAFKDNTLSKLLFTRTPGLFHKGFYQEKDFQDDQLAIRAFYQQHGYLSTAVAASTRYSDDRSEVVCHVKITEGILTRIERLTILGEQDNAVRKRLEKTLTLKEGDPFNPALLDQMISSMKDIYADDGYIQANIGIFPEFSSDQSQVSIVFQIQRGQQFRVGAITIEGVVRTKKEFVTRELQIHEGDVYSREKIKDTTRRLLQSGFYESASFRQLDPKSTSIVQPMLIEVTEASAKDVKFGVGYGTEDGVKGFVEYADKNLFHYGGRAVARIEASEERPKATLSYIHPHFIAAPNTLIATIFDDIRKDNDSFKNEQRGGRLMLSYDIKQEMSLTGGIFFEQNDPTEIKEDAMLSELDKERSNTAGLAMRAAIDTRDDLIFTRKGAYMQIGAKSAFNALGGENEFWELNGNASWFLPLFSKSVLASSISGQMIDSIDQSTEIPIYYRYFLGGDVSQSAPVRGFEKHEIGPTGIAGNKIGGDRMFVVNLEYRFPIYGPFGAVLFYDAGANWLDSNRFDASDFRDAIGTGLRIATPVGPLRFDYGWKLDRQKGESAGEYYLTIGSAF
ncbi:hypothetical protein U14_01961 [Candidatus Moduliflexus flocculans]|uniref:Outer membrane protein assembly factor BamA n=1 Tax=Candidatus Moduliflexus flocculans TaxID=1499966 RepID=A0A0S6VT76_9BACT|nr:hypothetical protein U14_01961 [Candidatus Moduliflexus flocculans]